MTNERLRIRIINCPESTSIGPSIATLYRTPMRLQGTRLYGALIWTLAAVWLVNFMIVLPLINPAFVDIVPLGVSFTSKLLFGIAAAACLQFGGRAARVGAAA